MADVLTFTASEFELIEELDFEEEIQRPENLRFFTLEEQLLDYFNKALPAKKHITKFDYLTVANEVDRIRKLYTKTVIFTDSDYTIDSSRKEVNVDWVIPMYSDFEYNLFDYKKSWNPLFEESRLPNFYPKMLTAMPKPHSSTGNGVALTKSSLLVDDNGNNQIIGLGLYERTKSVNHDDGTMSVNKVPIANTSDDIKIKGFFLKDRLLDIPNPLSEHPFLSSNKASRVVTEHPLNEAFPTIEAILTHGVPTTTDPYVEGLKFLKLYDVKLSQINWNLWKSRFPPAETITADKTVLSLEFDAPDRDIPSQSLQTAYVLPYTSGVSPRKWLMGQEDRGDLVVKMVMSKSGDSGLVPPEPLGEKLNPTFPKSTPTDCLATESFGAFLNTGLYRNGECIPMSYVEQERSTVLYANRVPWKETTEHDILKEHQRLLKKFQSAEVKEAAAKYEKYESAPESENRKEIRALLIDDNKTPEDKLYSIRKILEETKLVNSIYFDKTESFLICSHSLAILAGDLEKDEKIFYSEWTAIDEGYRSCRFCGERLTGLILVAQDDFDEAGNPLVSHGEMGNTVSADSSEFVSSLTSLKKLFILQNSGETMLYLLLSIFQVLPTESQLMPVIQNIRDLTLALNSKKTIKSADKERIGGILGIVGCLVLLQTHNPFLIPRRSFGSKILNLSGFPRDSDDDTKSPVIDIILSVLKSTFESSPSTFAGPIANVLRLVITKPKEIRKEMTVFVKQAVTKFKAQFVAAKERYEIAPEVEIREQIVMPLMVVENNVFKPFQRYGEEVLSICSSPSPHSFLSYKLLPNVVQAPLDLWKKIEASKSAEFVPIPEFEVLAFNPSDAEVRERLKFDVPKKLSKLTDFLKSDTDGIAFLSLFNRLLDITKTSKMRKESVFLNTQVDKSMLRDTAKGFVLELLKNANTEQINLIVSALKTDLTLNMLLLTPTEALKQDMELKAMERETFKMRMRQMNDSERQITKMLLDIGIASFVITNEDREMFAQEYNIPDPVDPNMPEEGYDISRDDMDALNPNGPEVPDHGDYGDNADRDVNDYSNVPNFDDGNDGF